MKVVGLTSGIACGKSLVSREFSRHNVPVIDADGIVHSLYKTSEPLKKKIAKEFGSEALAKSGNISRHYLSKIVFSNRAKLERLNNIVHPYVEREIRARLKEARKQKKKLVVVEAPLLVETGLNSLADYLVVVALSRQMQMKRLIERDSLCEKDALSRINSQLPLKEKMKLADFVIDNSSAKEHTRTRVLTLLKHLHAIEMVS